jgi:hypothetical protein
VTTGAPAGIHELADFVARHHALALVLAEAAGTLLADTADPAAKPMWAAAASRHAWHAELWANRYPAVPGLDLDHATTTARDGLRPVVDELNAEGVSADERAARHHAAVDRLRDELAHARTALDDRLDAPTARLFDLILADLTPLTPLTPAN